MNSMLITGCNRGIGLALVRNIVAGKTSSLINPKHLIATCRSREKAKELVEISEQHSNVKILEIDVCNFDQLEKFAQQVNELVGEDGLNVLFNNAGFSTKFSRIGLVKADDLEKTFKINTVAPIMLTKALLPLLKKSANKNPNEAPIKRACIVNMSSVLGSIFENKDGGLYPYKCSKAALNMATKCMSVDLKNDGVFAVSLHPGWVKTDMGGKNAPMDSDLSAQSILNVLSNLKQTDNGGFLNYDGKQIAY